MVKLGGLIVQQNRTISLAMGRGIQYTAGALKTTLALLRTAGFQSNARPVPLSGIQPIPLSLRYLNMQKSRVDKWEFMRRLNHAFYLLLRLSGIVLYSQILSDALPLASQPTILYQPISSIVQIPYLHSFLLGV